MTLDGIRLFIVTAKHLNISQAAREVHVSQSAASRQLKQFQENLGTKLLKENGRGIELTKSGWTFLGEVSPISLQLEALQKKYTPSQDSLALAGSHGPSTYLLPSLMTEFSRRYPSAKLTLQTRSSAELGELLLAAKVDLAVITNPKMSATLFKLEPFRREPLTAFVATNHPLARKRTILASDLDDHGVVVKLRRESESRSEEELVGLAKKGLKLNIVMRCESPESLKEAVRNGTCVGILNHDVIKREIARGEFKAVQLAGLDVAGQGFIVYSKLKPLSALAREFLSLLRASVMKSAPIHTVTRRSLHRRRRDNGTAIEQHPRAD